MILMLLLNTQIWMIFIKTLKNTTPPFCLVIKDKEQKKLSYVYSPLSKAFERQIKTIEDNGGKQMKQLKYRGKQFVESNGIIKNGFDIDKDGVPLEQQNKIFIELVEEKSYKFQNLKENINPNNLIYKYKTKGVSPKDFSNYQNPIDLFINL